MASHSSPALRRAAWVLVLALGAAGLWLWSRRPPKPVRVTTRAVVQGRVEELVASTTQGMVRARRTVQVRAPQPAPVSRLWVAEGDRVREGQILVQFDDRVVAAQEAVAEAQARAAARLLTQAEGGTAAGVTPPVETEKLRDSAEIAARQLASVRVQRSLYRVVAPWAGLVTRTMVEPGDTPVPGQPLVELLDDSELHVEARIDETDLPRVRVGQAVRIRLEAWVDRPLAGTVATVAPQVTQEPPFSRTVAIDVALAPRPGAPDGPTPRPGMSADVEILVGEGTGLVVPTVAVFEREGRRFSWVVRDGRLSQQDVSVGVSNWEQTLVEGGLGPGDRVVVELDTKGLTEGAPAEEVVQDDAAGVSTPVPVGADPERAGPPDRPAPGPTSP